MTLFIVMTGINIYELKWFGFLYECISDYQTNYLSSKGLVVSFTKNMIVVLCSYLVLRAFRNPEAELDDKKHKLIVIDDDKDLKIHEEITNYVEYVI
jgi:hypothetical protein